MLCSSVGQLDNSSTAHRAGCRLSTRPIPAVSGVEIRRLTYLPATPRPVAKLHGLSDAVTWRVVDLVNRGFFEE